MFFSSEDESAAAKYLKSEKKISIQTSSDTKILILSYYNILSVLTN